MVTITGWRVNLTNTTIGAHCKTLPRSFSNSFPKSINFLPIRSMLRGRILRVLFEIYRGQLAVPKHRLWKKKWSLPAIWFDSQNLLGKRAQIPTKPTQKTGRSTKMRKTRATVKPVLTLLQQINWRDKYVHMYVYIYTYIQMNLYKHSYNIHIHIVYIHIYICSYLFNSCCFPVFYWEIKLQPFLLFLQPPTPPKKMPAIRKLIQHSTLSKCWAFNFQYCINMGVLCPVAFWYSAFSFTGSGTHKVLELYPRSVGRRPWQWVGVGVDEHHSWKNRYWNKPLIM